jgi:hypothetical protein
MNNFGAFKFRTICAVAAFSLLYAAFSNLWPQSSSPAISEGTGPYKAIMESDPTLPTNAMYRPKDLDKMSTKLPIVAFGNSGCASNGALLRRFLTEIASRRPEVESRMEKPALNS